MDHVSGIKITPAMIENLLNRFIINTLDNPSPTPECHREWWDMACSDRRFVAIAAPRGHAKSTAITLLYVLACLLFNARKYIIILSDTEAQSILFLGDLKRQLTDNEELIALFGIKRLVKDAETEIIVEFENGFTAMVQAKGTGQKVRGSKWNNYRPDLIVCDDLENEDIVLNDDRREKFRKWFSGSVIPALNKNGILRMVGTILHMDSQLNRFMPKYNTPGATIGTLVWKNNPRAVWHSALYKAHPSMGDFSQVLWPGHKGADELRAYQDHCRQEGLTDIYSAEILNDPVDPANARFKRGDLLPMMEKDFEKHRYYYVGTDFAVTINARRDWTVFVVASMGDDEMLMVEHVIRERMDTHDIIETIISLQKEYNPQFFAFEKGTILNTLLPGIKIRSFETGQFINYEAFASAVDKDARASTIKARVRAQRVKFNKEAEWYPTFEEELMKFPLGHDDQVDAFAILGSLMTKVHRAETQKELEEEEYTNFRRSYGFFDQGRNKRTGY